MKVKTKIKLLYAGEIYPADTILEMDDCTAAISEKYGRVIILGDSGGDISEVEEEFEVAAEGLPDLMTEKAKKKK